MSSHRSDRVGPLSTRYLHATTAEDSEVGNPRRGYTRVVDRRISPGSCVLRFEALPIGLHKRRELWVVGLDAPVEGDRDDLLTRSLPVAGFSLDIGCRRYPRISSGGGAAVDYSARGDVMLGSNLSLSGFVQYEQWRFPVLSATSQSDVTAFFQFTFYPHWRIR
jgi:hypothetical protein